VSTAIHLNQIFYWSGKTKSGVFYKRYEEWKDELYQPIKKLRANVAKFVEIGIIKTKVKRVQHLDSNGNPTGFYGDRAVFYEVNWKIFEEMFLEFAERQCSTQEGGEDKENTPGELPKHPQGNFPNIPRGTSQTSPGDFPYMTETTTEITDIQKQDFMSGPSGPDGNTETSASLDEKKTTKPLNEKKTTKPLSLENNGASRRKKKEPSPFDKKAAQKFAEVVGTFRKVQKNSDLRQWANVFRQMREVDDVPKKDIRETIEWYEKHIGDEYIPEAFSATTFRRKYADGLFTAAMRRCSQNGKSPSNGRNRLTRENMWADPENLLPGGILKVEIGSDGKEYDGLLLHRVRRRLLERFGQGRPLEEELQTVLDEDFSGEKGLSISIIGRVW